MKDLRVWTRVGDQDDYHDFAGIDEAAEYVHGVTYHSLGIWRGHVERYQGPALHGINILGAYQGDNGISFYWGDAEAQFDSEISDQELKTLRRLLS